MEKEGLVTKVVTQNTGRPLKNIYTITSQGKKELETWLLEPAEYRKPREEFLLKLFFSASISPANLILKIKEEKYRQQQFLENYRNVKNTLKTNGKLMKQKNRLLWLSILNLGKYQRETIIRWCDEILQTLESEKNPSDKSNNP
jgi:PadR family transcriptional regulator, regulatory protein AphA